MPRISGEPRGSGVQAVVFALDILEYIARCQASVGVSELARAFETTKSRMHRHLQTLVTAGYLRRDDATERYRVSARLMALGQAVGENFELAAAARQIALDLRDAQGHAIALSQPEPEGMRIVMMIHNKSNFEIGVKPGSVLSYHGSAQGKIGLAFGDPAVLRGVLGSQLEAATPYTITDPLRLAAEVEAVRARGWAVAPNEAMIGLNTLAVPVFDALGRFAGSVAATDSVQYLPAEPAKEQIAAIAAAGREISANLGYRPAVAQRGAEAERAGK